MTDLDRWQEQLDHRLANIRRSGARLSDALARVRGRAEVRGVSIEVNTSGDITDLQIAPGVMRWTSDQLAAVIEDGHRKARAIAAAKAEQIIRRADPALREPLQQMRAAKSPQREPQRSMTEEEAQAADDAYFERMNRGWNP